MNQKPQDIDENLLLQYLLGNANDEYRTSVETWLDADSRNRLHLDQLESLWLETGKLSPAPVAVDVERAWNKISTRIGNHEASLSSAGLGKIIRMRPVRYLMRIAAVILLMAGIFSVYKLVTKPGNEIELASGMSVIYKTLPDGSKVTLNQNSRLTYPSQFDQGNREVRLIGEGFFEVKHDKAHPFIVNGGEANVRVLGTTFSVRVRPADETKQSKWGYPMRFVEVKVTEGRVMLYSVHPESHDTASLILTSGETGIWNATSAGPVRTGTTLPDDTYWANRSLDFRSTALSEIIGIIEKYYPVRITVSDPAILNCRLTASFVNESAGRMITVIAESFGLNLEASGQNYHLTGHGCNKEHN